MFSGDDVYGWLVCFERHFRVTQINERERLEMVLVALEGGALTWFEWWEEEDFRPGAGLRMTSLSVSS